MHFFRAVGHDGVTGGAIEIPVYVVNRVSSDRFGAGDIFDDRDAALACFAERIGRP